MTKHIHDTEVHKTANRFHFAPELVFQIKLSNESPLTNSPNMKGYTNEKIAKV